METLNLRPIEQAKISCAKKLFNEMSNSKVVYHDVDSYQSLLNIMNDPSLDKRYVNNNLMNVEGEFMADFKYEIVEHIGTLSESAKGWTKELNRISWNGGEPKYDIRDWAPEHEKMGKGVTLSEDEMAKLKELL